MHVHAHTAKGNLTPKIDKTLEVLNAIGTWYDVVLGRPQWRKVNLRSMSGTKPTPNPGSGFELILVFMLQAIAAKALCAWGGWWGEARHSSTSPSPMPALLGKIEVTKVGNVRCHQCGWIFKVMGLVSHQPHSAWWLEVHTVNLSVIPAPPSLVCFKLPQCWTRHSSTQESKHAPSRAGFVPLIDLRLTSHHLGLHSVDFMSLKLPWHHPVSSASGVQDLEEYSSFPFAGWACRCIAVQIDLLVQSEYLLAHSQPRHHSHIPPPLFSTSCHSVELAVQVLKNQGTPTTSWLHATHRSEADFTSPWIALDWLRITEVDLAPHCIECQWGSRPQGVSHFLPGVRFPFAGWVCRCIAVHFDLLVVRTTDNGMFCWR